MPWAYLLIVFYHEQHVVPGLVVPTRNPDPVPTNNGFSSVTALASNNVWAVGGTSKGTLIEHWNGSQWSVVASPSVGADGGHLSAVAAVSASDIWAVGSYFTGAPNQLDRTLIVHWNGSQWSVVPSTNPATFSDNLNGLTVVSARNIWTVGSSQGQKTGEHTLVEHWNGTSWKTVSSPNPQPNEDYLTGVAALSASDIWAVGDYATSVPGQTIQTLIEHWDGSQWSIVSSPSPGTKNILHSITVVPGTQQLWTVGGYPTIAEFYC